jgi:hypothetical protein
MTRRQQIEESVDAKLFLALRDIAPPLLLSSYKIETTSLQYLYNKFLSDRQNPEFEYQLPKEERLLECQSALCDLRDEIIHNQTNKSIESQYLLKITQYLQTIDILLASVLKDWSAFEQANIARYGLLDEKEAGALIAVRQKKHDIFRDVLVPASAKSSYRRPLPEEFEELASFFDINAFPEADYDSTYSSNEVCLLWNDELKMKYPRWHVERSLEAAYIRTDNRKRTIFIPETILLRGRKLKSLFAHEVGVHVRRREEGKLARLQLLSIGMAGSESAEEGLATMAEQVVGGRVRLGGTDRYIALAIATGAVDGVKRDFTETFTLLEEYFRCRYTVQYETKRAMELSQIVAWKLCVKIFRGGNPSIKGNCLRKEKIYHEGGLAMWRVFREQPEVFVLWSRGKFDLTNSDQVALVREYTI